MCGVFGIYYFDGSKRPDAATLRRSADAIAHRGPDGTGVFAGEGIGLAHTRLSLVDLSERSDQPMWDQARRYCLVYNGEIYNFRELRSELEARGVTFVTSSDTEVLLQCLIHDGPRRTLPRLQGMFAFGFFDTESNTLVCARDRFGIKPLLLYQDTDCFMFASEAKALRPWIRLRANPFQTIRYLMNYGVPIRERGFFDDVEMLTPGTVVTVERGCDVERATFADLPGMLDPAAREELGRLSPDQAVDRVDELL